MKKKLLFLAGIMLIIVLSSSALTAVLSKEEKTADKITIVTSFYPMYVLAKNVVGNIDNVEVVNLTEYQSGCLHDYQLTTSDMKRLENADVFIMNGGGMESFMSDILKAYPNLPIINASEGIQFLEGVEHEHEDDNAVQDAESQEESSSDVTSELEYNAHVWLNMNDYLVQIKNVQKALSSLDESNSSAYQANGDLYQQKIRELKDNAETELAGLSNKNIVIFHDSFAYLAQELGLNVIHTVDMDSETYLSAGEIGEVVDEVREKDVRVLLTEKQYSTSIADNVAQETGAKVYIMDSIVTGDMTEDGYINAMKYNLEILKNALK